MALVAATQVYTALVVPEDLIYLTLAATALAKWFVEAQLYLNLTTLQGAPATASLAVYGDVLP